MNEESFLWGLRKEVAKKFLTLVSRENILFRWLAFETHSNASARKYFEFIIENVLSAIAVCVMDCGSPSGMCVMHAWRVIELRDLPASSLIHLPKDLDFHKRAHRILLHDKCIYILTSIFFVAVTDFICFLLKVQNLINQKCGISPKIVMVCRNEFISIRYWLIYFFRQ